MMSKNLKIDYTDSMTQKTKKKVSLSKIADFSTADSPKSIYRKGQTRYIAVKADIKDGYVVSDVSREVEKIVNQTKKPVGYEMELDGENEATTEAMGQVLLMMALGVLFDVFDYGGTVPVIVISIYHFVHDTTCLYGRLPWTVDFGK